MKTVVLDGYTLNPGDLHWGPLLDLGDCKIYERTPAAETVERAWGAEILLTNKVVLDRETLAQLPDLKYIGVLATGVNVVDLPAAKERGIVVTNVPATAQCLWCSTRSRCCWSSRTTSATTRAACGRGDWVKSKDFAYWNYPLLELAGLKMD